MKQKNWNILFAASLVLLSAVLYIVHYLIFVDYHHIFIYMLGDIAFVPIEVLLVTLILHKLLITREKRSIMKKLNMVIGTFFSEVGNRLLIYFSDFDPKLEQIRKDLMVSEDWTEKEFTRISRILKNYDYEVEIHKIDLEQLRNFLMEKRNFLVRLMENPILLEHESFTELLLAVFHLTEELEARENILALPDTDIEHLSGDIKRAYVQFVHNWLDYMNHLKDNYPYLFSLAMRTNPFNQESSPIVR